MTRRILSIDGGGIKGVFAASFLATLEDALHEKIGQYFDLIVGTSTGGIIALGLGLGFPAREILALYERSARAVFPRRGAIAKLKGLLRPKYASAALRETLDQQFGMAKLGESTSRLVIPSFNIETGEVYLYKTAHHPRFERDYGAAVVDVALATAAAPGSFPTHRTSAGTPLVDGGMWANNPVAVAVVEAIGVLSWSKDQLVVLSLGCPSEPLDVGLARVREMAMGRAYWALKAVDAFLAAQSSGALGITTTLLGHERVVRISPHVPQGRFGLDRISEIPSLRGLGDSEARKSLPRLRELFFGTRAEPFEPYHRLSDRGWQG